MPAWLIAKPNRSHLCDWVVHHGTGDADLGPDNCADERKWSLVVASDRRTALAATREPDPDVVERDGG